MEQVFSFQNTKAILYVVSTPIGNLKEFSPRAIEVIKNCDFVASEDTRTTGALLKEFNICKPMISCHEHNEEYASEKIINLLKDGKIIALTSDAGYPGISDPGERVIKKVISSSIPVSVINGSSAFLPALIASGLDTEHFYFHGFLKSKSSERKQELLKLKSYDFTLIFYESPHRILDTLKDIYEIFGDRKITLAREITKIYEQYIRGNISELLSLSKDNLKGEMVLIIEGNNEVKETIDEETLISIIKSRLKEPISKKDLAKELSEIYDLKKNDIYRLIIDVDKK